MEKKGREKMVSIADNRATHKTSFKLLQKGEVFEYLATFYIKTNVSQECVNAIDLQNGCEDIIGLDAIVEPVDVQMIITESEDF